MRLTVFQPLKSDGTYGPSWSWNARSGPEIVASANGYNNASGAVRAALNHGAQWYKLITGEPLSPEQRKALRAHVHVVHHKAAP